MIEDSLSLAYSSDLSAKKFGKGFPLSDPFRLTVTSHRFTISKIAYDLVKEIRCLTSWAIIIVGKVTFFSTATVAVSLGSIIVCHVWILNSSQHSCFDRMSGC